MRILTAGDSAFYHCLTYLAESVRKFYGQQLIVYDLGLTHTQKNELDAKIVSIDIHVDYNGYASYNNTNFIKTTHKPFCIKHYFENHSEPVIYTDADCLFLEKVELDSFDVAVTIKPKRKRDTTNYFNGIINAGVIFFNAYPEKLMDRWIQGCLRPNVTDQMVLAEILSETIDWKRHNKIYDWHGYKIKTLRIEDYNDYYLKTGKIFHFKGNRHNSEIYHTLVAAIRKGKSPYDFLGKKKTKYLISRISKFISSCAKITSSI